MFQDMTLVDLAEIAEDVLTGVVELDSEELHEFQLLVLDRLAVVQWLEELVAATKN